MGTKFSIKKLIAGIGTTVMLAGGVAPGFSSVVVEAEDVTDPTNYSVVDETNDTYSAINNSDVQSRITELEEQRYKVEKDSFFIEGEEFIRFSNENESGFVHINDAQLTTLYATLGEDNLPEQLTIDTVDGQPYYINIDENGNPVAPVNSGVTTFSAASTTCQVLVNGAGGIISGIYGAALGTAIGGPAGTLAGVAASGALGAAWTPVSGAC